MKNTTIVESNVEPSKENLWLYKGELRWFGPNGWEAVSASDNAPKYVFNTYTYPTVNLSKNSPHGTIKVDSYYELNGVKTGAPILFDSSNPSLLQVYWERDKNAVGSYIVHFGATYLDGDGIVIIQGREGRNFIVAVHVSGFGDLPTTTTTTTTTSTPAPTTTTTSTTSTTSTSTKPPVSVKVRNSTSLDLIVSGIKTEVEGVNTAIGVGQEIICYPRSNTSITIKQFIGAILPQLIIRDAVKHTEIPNSRGTAGTWYYIECNDILGLIQEGLTTIEVVEDTTSSLE